MKETQSFGMTEFQVMCDMDLRQCFYKAFKVIEPRQGYMNKNGQFVKQLETKQSQPPAV
jgi:hypothetical protein